MVIVYTSKGGGAFLPSLFELAALQNYKIAIQADSS